MNDRMQERLIRASRFLGWGDPTSAKVWFIRDDSPIEYESPEKLDDEFLLPDADLVSEPKPWRRSPVTSKWPWGRSPIPRALSRVLIGLQEGVDALSDGRDNRFGTYADLELFAPSSCALFSFLYPLGWRTYEKNWPDRYRDWFGLTHAEYRDRVARGFGRYDRIWTTWKRNSPPLTICWPKRSWADHVACLNLGDRPSVTEGPFVLYPDDGVVLSPFIASMNSWEKALENVRALVETVRSHDMNPFAEEVPPPDDPPDIRCRSLWTAGCLSPAP